MRPAALIASLLLALPTRASAQDFQCAVATAPAGRGIGAQSASVGGDDIVLRVAALYTPEAADSAIARGMPIGEWITNAFAAWQAVLDSASAPGPRVVALPLGVLSLDMAETGACFSDLDTFRAHPRSAGLRDSLLANLVVLFSARCSSAYQCTSDSDCEASAYAMAYFPVAGAPTPEGGHALAHEAGHLLGMRHDIADDPTPGYNHGYRNEPAAFFTVMATRGPLPRTDLVSAYSDPLRTFEGLPLGTSDTADNARVLRENAPIASTWNQGTPSEPGPGAARLTLRASPNPTVDAWLVRVDAAAGGVELALVDATGRRSWSTALAGAGPWNVSVPGGNLAPGVYLLRATWNGGAGAGVLRLTRTR